MQYQQRGLGQRHNTALPEQGKPLMSELQLVLGLCNSSSDEQFYQREHWDRHWLTPPKSLWKPCSAARHQYGKTRHSQGLAANPNWFFFCSCTWLRVPSRLIAPSGPQQENRHPLRHLLGQQTQLPALDGYFGVEIEMQIAAETTTMGELLLFLLKRRDIFHLFPPIPSTDFTIFLREGNSSCVTQRENHLPPITEMLTCIKGAGWDTVFGPGPWVSDRHSSVMCPGENTGKRRSNRTKSQRLKLQARDEQKEVSSKEPPSQTWKSSSHVQRRSQEEKSTTFCMEEAAWDQVRMITVVKG